MLSIKQNKAIYKLVTIIFFVVNTANETMLVLVGAIILQVPLLFSDKCVINATLITRKFCTSHFTTTIKLANLYEAE